jgi:hypothetical protein
MLRFPSLALVAVALAACAGTSTHARPSRDATIVRVYRPGDPEPSPAEELTFLTPRRPEQRPLVLRRIEVAPRIQMGALTEWTARYPYAEGALREWVRSHPGAAALLFRGDQDDPERVEALTEWAISNPAEKVESFLALHGGREFLRPLLDGEHRPGLDAYLAWCRKSPHAAVELVHHGHGLAWAGEHLYARELGSRAAMLGPRE